MVPAALTQEEKETKQLFEQIKNEVRIGVKKDENLLNLAQTF